MNKQEFLTLLRQGLTGLPREAIEDHLAFYGEMIDDRVEEGLSEEEAVAQIGPVEKVVVQILDETPLTAIVREKARTRQPLRGWEITLLILGFPLWFPLLVSAASVIVSLYFSLWAVIISFWASFVSVAASALGCVIGAAILAVQGHMWPAAATFGAALICAGLAIFLWFFCDLISRGTCKMTKKFFAGIKSRLTGKGEAK